MMNETNHNSYTNNVRERIVRNAQTNQATKMYVLKIVLCKIKNLRLRRRQKKPLSITVATTLLWPTFLLSTWYVHHSIKRSWIMSRSNHFELFLKHLITVIYVMNCWTIRLYVGKSLIQQCIWQTFVFPQYRITIDVCLLQ